MKTFRVYMKNGDTFYIKGETFSNALGRKINEVGHSIDVSDWEYYKELKSPTFAAEWHAFVQLVKQWRKK